MKTIATYNIKGGVGKTTTAINLAYEISRTGARTLVWDLDPQGAASFFFRIKPKIKGGGKGLVGREQEIDSLVKGTDFENLDLLPADFSYRNMDLLLDRGKNPTARLRKLIKPLSEEYDYLILDCPPSISLVSENVFQAADVLLVPTIPTVLSLRTLIQLLDFCKANSLEKLNVLPFFSMVDRRKSLHRNIVDMPPVNRISFLETYIPYASEVERMGVSRAPLGSIRGCHRSARRYQDLWDEVKIWIY